MSNWRTTTMEELLEFHDAKRVPLNSRERAIRQGPYPYYGASGIVDYIDGYLFDGRYLLIAEDGENLRSRKTPIAFFARGKFWVNNHAHIVTGRKGVADDEFLKHWFSCADINGYITGAAQPKLSQGSLKRIEIKLPEFPAQRRIASVLSAYDDLIENNTRRIAILEEMARRLYEEWFVKFRFPGHEGSEFVETESGRKPLGWDAVPLGTVADVRWGDTTKTKKSYVDEGYVAFSAAGPDGLLPYFDFDRKGIVLSAIGANCGATWLARGRWSCIKNTIRFWSLSARVNNEYLFFATSREGFWPKRGAAQPFISQGDARDCRIVVPPEELGVRFGAFVEPSLDLARRLEKVNANLRAQRDLLLPKLISGEIDVSQVAEPEADAA